MKLPRFHLRDLFWLVLVCACLCAWWVDHRDEMLILEAVHDAGYGLGSLDAFPLNQGYYLYENK